MKAETLLVDGLTLRHEGTLLLDDVCFAGYAGELLSICGFHDSGKSVLSSVLAGERDYDGGTITLHGAPLNPRAEPRRVAYIGTTSGLIEEMTIAENVFAFRRKHPRLWPFSMKAAKAQTVKILEAIGLPYTPDTRVARLSRAEQHILQIARAQSQDCAIVILDDITGDYSTAEYANLLALIRKNAQMTFLHISNRLDPLVHVSDRVLCFRDGRITNVLFRGAFSAKLFSLALHGERASLRPERFTQPIGSTPVLHLAPREGVRGMPIHVQAGEVVGILDLHGGYWMRLRDLLLDGKSYALTVSGVPMRGLEEALQNGLAFVSTNSHEMIFPYMNIYDQVTLNVSRRYSRLGVMNQRMLRYAYDQMVSDPEALRSAMGDHIDPRKLSLVRTVITSPKALVLENVLTGLDNPTKRQMLTTIRKIARNGMGILLISSSADECRLLCDRTLVLQDETYYTWAGKSQE